MRARGFPHTQIGLNIRKVTKDRGSNISSIRCSVSSPDETPRRELKIRRAGEYFWRTSRCVIWWWNTASHVWYITWNTVLNAWYYFSIKMILEGEIEDAKMSSFSSYFQKPLISFVFSSWIINEFEKERSHTRPISPFSSKSLIIRLICLTHSLLNSPCGSRSFLPFVTSSVLTVKDNFLC